MSSGTPNRSVSRPNVTLMAISSPEEPKTLRRCVPSFGSQHPAWLTALIWHYTVPDLLCSPGGAGGEWVGSASYRLDVNVLGGPQNLVAKSPTYITQNPPIVVCIMCFFIYICLRACS